MTEQITMQALTWKGIAAVIGIILPIIVLIVWKKNQGRIRLKPAVAGAVVFIIFAQMLEQFQNFSYLEIQRYQNMSGRIHGHM